MAKSAGGATLPSSDKESDATMLRNADEERESGLRPLDPRHDLIAVADLIELGFRDELDPAARQMLAQIRRLQRPAWPLRTILGSPPTLQGFVWVEEGQIVGNLSLRRAAPRRSRGYLIGNVVVHPAYRRQGIARTLMEHALTQVNRQGGHWVGLEVRADNDAALGLYRSLGFREVGRTIHYLHPGTSSWPPLPDSPSHWRKAKPDDRPVWLALAHALYGREQAQVLEIDGRAYAYGRWERAADLWFLGWREWAWIDRHTPPQRALYLRRDRRGRYHLWELYLQPQLAPSAIEEALGRLTAITRRRPWPVILLFPHHPVVDATLLKLGFRHHRHLIQMRLDFVPQRRIRLPDQPERAGHAGHRP